jgi:ribosome-interacting GTPase 1
MPANLSPEYKAAEASFRKAREPRERLHWLREMLRTIPKHKGTDHLQADIKHRIKDLSEEVEGPRKGGAARHGPTLVLRPEGAGQVALIGRANCGKSTLHARLTGSNAHAAPYPFTTQYPEPGMMPFDDIHFQLVDLPAISPEHALPMARRNFADGRRVLPRRRSGGAVVRRAGAGRARDPARKTRDAHRALGARGRVIGARR